MAYYSKERNIELSLLKYVTDCFDNFWGELPVKVVKSFNFVNMGELPVVAMELADNLITKLEIGSTQLYRTYSVFIDIFARSAGERIDISSFLIEKLKDGCAYIEYSQDSGNTKDLVGIGNGRVATLSFDESMKLDLGEYGQDVDKYRHYIAITVRR